MKGASDGGMFVPHSESRFPGFDPESKELDTETLKRYIVSYIIVERADLYTANQILCQSQYAGHVAEYMESLEEEDDERFKKQFATYLADGIGGDDLEEIYTEAHKNIRENPVKEAKDKDTAKWKSESKKHKHQKLTYDQRKERVQKKIAAYKAGELEQ